MKSLFTNVSISALQKTSNSLRVSSCGGLSPAPMPFMVADRINEVFFRERAVPAKQTGTLYIRLLVKHEMINEAIGRLGVIVVVVLDFSMSSLLLHWKPPPVNVFASSTTRRTHSLNPFGD